MLKKNSKMSKKSSKKATATSKKSTKTVGSLSKEQKNPSEKQIARVRKMSKEKQREFVNKQVEKSFKNDKYAQTSEVKSCFIGWWEKLGLWK